MTPDPNDIVDPPKPEKPTEPWLLVVGVVLVTVFIALLPLACGGVFGLFVRGYDLAAGR